MNLVCLATAVVVLFIGLCIATIRISGLKRNWAAARDFQAVLNDSRDSWRNLYHETLQKLGDAQTECGELRSKVEDQGIEISRIKHIRDGMQYELQRSVAAVESLKERHDSSIAQEERLKTLERMKCVSLSTQGLRGQLDQANAELAELRAQTSSFAEDKIRAANVEIARLKLFEEVKRPARDERGRFKSKPKQFDPST